jgi:hypothetical protein
MVRKIIKNHSRNNNSHPFSYGTLWTLVTKYLSQDRVLNNFSKDDLNKMAVLLRKSRDTDPQLPHKSVEQQVEEPSAGDIPASEQIMPQAPEVEKVDDIIKKIEDYNPQKVADGQRDFIVRVMVVFYVVLMILILIGVPAYNLWGTILTNGNPAVTLDLVTVLTAVGSTVGTLLGFIVGYYFKNSQ